MHNVKAVLSIRSKGPPEALLPVRDKLTATMYSGCPVPMSEEYTDQKLNLLMRQGAFVFHGIPYK